MIVGIIGLGRMGLIHAKNIVNLGHQYSYWDKNKPEGSSRDAVIEDSDAVVIATPSSEHFSDIADCLFKAKPVFVEKPIFGSGGSGSKWDAVCSLAKDQTVMVGSNLRYHPVVKVVKERMHELGGTYNSAWFSLSQKKERPRDHVVLNWGSHEVDLALYLLNKGLEFWSHEARVTEDNADFYIRRASGPPVHIHLDYNGNPSEHRYFTIHGNDASIHADLDNFVVMIFSRHGQEVIAVEGSHEQTYRDEMAEFIRRVEGKEPDGIGATGADGLRCLKVLLEAQR